MAALDEITLNALELHWNPAMYDEVELPGDVGTLDSVSINRSNLLIDLSLQLVQAPAQLGAMQNETTRVWVVSGLQCVLLQSHFSQEPFQNYQQILVESGFLFCEHGWRNC